MSSKQLSPVVRCLRKLAARNDTCKLSDPQLLERFAARQDTAAFEAILARHGSMVLNVCRRILRDPSAVEDAFQATFLVLVRKSTAIRKGDSLCSWLYGVACRTAARANVETAKRQARESAVPRSQPRDPVAEVTGRELLALLDAELRRLPLEYQSPLVLCYLEGRTRDEAAGQLGWSLATLGRRLERGRELLRNRLTRRGLTLSATLFPLLLMQGATAACLPTSLITATLEAAASVAAGSTAAVVSPKVAVLTEGVLQAMFLTKLNLAASVLVVSLIGFGASLFSYRTWAAENVASAGVEQNCAKPPQNQPSPPEKPKTDKEQLRGAWALVSANVDGQEAAKEVVIKEGHRRTFMDDKFTIERADQPNNIVEVEYKIDSMTMPKSIDMVPRAGPDKGKKVPAIFKIDGDTLTICEGEVDKIRPTKFASKKGSGVALLVFQRQPIAWGAPQNGLQVGMGFADKGPFRAGQQVTFQIFVRNVGKERVELPIQNRAWRWHWSAGNLITGSADKYLSEGAPLTLDPGEEKLAPGLIPTFRTQGLVAGRYRIDSYGPLWISRFGGGSVGFNAKPAEIEFELLPGDSGTAPRATVKPAQWKIAGAPPTWGTSVGGLQVGVRFKDGNSRFKQGETVTLEWYLSNLSDRDYAFKEFVPKQPHDFVDPSVVDLQGKRQQVHRNYPWTPGREAGHFEQRIIPPGEALFHGSGSFEIRTALDQEAKRTVLVAPPGKYKLSVSCGAKWESVPDFDISLESGQLHFEVIDPKGNANSIKEQVPAVNEDVQKLIKQLDDDSFQTREKATKALKALGRRIVSQLEAALVQAKSPEVRRRLQQLLEPYRIRPESDLTPLQGTWMLVAAQKDGKEWPVEDVSESYSRLTIAGLTYTRRDGTKGNIKLNAAAKPKEMTLDGLINLFCIYELDGDTLRICYHIGRRPTAFATAINSEITLFTYRRK